MDVEALNQISAAAKAECWRRGVAHRWALDEGQQLWRERFLATEPLSASVWNIGRQRGKTFDAVFLALETGVTVRGAIIRYCAKTKDSAVGIVGPAWTQLVATMPESMRPTPGRNDFEWVFPETGATFVLFGTDAQSFSRGRGPRTHVQFFDEAGFYQDLEQVEAALLPSLQTTGGKALYLSTPPDSPAHPFVRRMHSAQAAGRYVHDTFWSNPRVDHDAVIKAESERLGLTRAQLLESTYFRREYMAEVVTEETRAAVPGWTMERAARLAVALERPRHFDGYVGADWGVSPDPKALLLAWYHPSHGLFVEYELEKRNATIREWVVAAKALEKEVWGVDGWDGTLLGAPEWLKRLPTLPPYLEKSLRQANRRQPFLRVGDDDSEVLQELVVEHGYLVLPTRKHDKHLSVDALNALVIAERIHVHPRCVRLIEQLGSTLWNKGRTEWERTDRDHGDLVDALVYLCRNVSWHRLVDPPPPPPPWAPKPEKRTLGDAFDRKR